MSVSAGERAAADLAAEELAADCADCVFPNPGRAVAWSAVWGCWLCANCRWVRTHKDLDQNTPPMGLVRMGLPPEGAIFL